MSNQPFSIRSFPKAILHIDGDAFFASCEQARDPALAGRPVVTGRERGIASSMSYEAKARGVTRGMRLFEIRQVCPEVVILPSDYETYSLYSQRFFSIVRRYTEALEEYSIDECFADITGMRAPLRMSYPEIAAAIQKDLCDELGFTFSVGLGPTKVIAKIGSKYKKPHGLTVIPAREIHTYLATIPIESVWGVGPQTSAYLQKYGVFTALAFASLSEAWVTKKLSKPFIETWRELRGEPVFPLETKPQKNTVSIQKVKTFTPPSDSKAFVFSQLSKNIENACIKARRHGLAAAEVTIFLRTQDFRHTGLRVRFSKATAFSNKVIHACEKLFAECFDHRQLYRATGVVLSKLTDDVNAQLDLFGSHLEIEKLTRLYHGVDALSEKFGKHTVFAGSSFHAQRLGAHAGGRGDLPSRHTELFTGENARQRLGIPLLAFGEAV
ncbi:MAG: DNA polymerase IV [Patescibacteria group bacterium]